ncbi:MAG: succinylglutamate desuccinylase/aspartoacylase family protein [Acidobacteriota bacterium]
MPVATLPKAPPLPGVERVVGRRRGAAAGPTLLCIAALHGNEPAGFLGVRRVLAALAGISELRGEIVALVGNRKALAAGQRFLVEDLNRLWSEERLEQLRAGVFEPHAEDEEMLELDDEIRRVTAEARGPIYVLDLHTTSGPGTAFAVLDDTLPNRDFALEFPAPLVLGLEEELSGPLLPMLLERGMVTVGFESGQHDDPASVDGAEAAVWIALETSGVLPPGHPEVARARALLSERTSHLPHVTEVRYRHPVDPADRFTMEPGFASFDRVTVGQRLAADRNGPIHCPEDGLILMPLYQDQGEDGFFIVRAIEARWLRVSERLRRLGIEKWVHWLPGVRRHPSQAHTFVVNRRVARWFALELFHLLGFRRHGRVGDELVVSRRSGDV